MTANLDPFDPAALRLSPGAVPPPARPVRPPRHRPGEWFLRGPVPWPWLEAAARLPGKALALSLCLWREAGRRRCRTVKLSPARRALRSLEAAGLVVIDRQPGRGLAVTIVDAPAATAGPAPPPAADLDSTPKSG
jgi:hypothetical protein